MPYRIAGIDVHKKMLAVVVADVEIDGEYQFERQKVGTSPADLRTLADWLVAREVEEVVMESTAQYWRPVWDALEQHWRPQAPDAAGAARCRARSISPKPSRIGGAGGRKKDFPDAERLVKRLVAQELTLSFVPDAEQRLWRTVMRRKYQVTRNRVQLHNRLERCSRKRTSSSRASSPISWASAPAACCRRSRTARPIPATLAALAAPRFRANAAAIVRRLQCLPDAASVYRRLLKLDAGRTPLINDHLDQLDQQMADLLAEHHAAVQRLAEVPGWASIPRSRSLPKSARPPPRFPPRSISPRGWAPVPATKRAPA